MGRQLRDRRAVGGGSDEDVVRRRLRVEDGHEALLRSAAGAGVPTASRGESEKSSHDQRGRSAAAARRAPSSGTARDLMHGASKRRERRR